MTFYNVIFGLVFVMSFFTTISVLGETNSRLLLLSESLLILIMSFNDIINTSDAIEFEKSDYPLSLKALDALNFIFYMMGIFAIQPKNSVYNLDVTNIIPKHNEIIYWIAVMMTFLISFLWNITKDKNLSIRYNKFILAFLLFSIIMVIISARFHKILVVMSPTFLLIYFIFMLMKIIKPSFQNNER